MLQDTKWRFAQMPHLSAECAHGAQNLWFLEEKWFGSIPCKRGLSDAHIDFASDHWLIACWSRFTDTNGTISYKSDELCTHNHVVRFPSSIVFTSWCKYNEERQVYLLIRFWHVLSCCPIGIIGAREMYNECLHNSPHWHIDPPPQQSQEPSWWVDSLVEWICRMIKEKRGFYFEPFKFPSSGVSGAQDAYLWSALQWWHPIHEVPFQLVGLVSLNTCWYQGWCLVHSGY
jgi:hypothetical protein